MGPFGNRPSPAGFCLSECPRCGIVFLFPQPSDAELAPYYDAAYYGEGRKKFLSPVEVGIASLSALKWKKLRTLLRPGDRMLDIGCGRGALVKLARQAGWEAWGLERPSPVGHRLPWVRDQSLPECNFPDNHFQLVILWHVLEHLPDPVATLREIHRILKPGGYLSLAVPNYGGAQAAASGPHWFHLDLPRHFWHFRPSSLGALLGSAGFSVPRYGTFSFEYDWYGTLQSWMNSALGDRNRLYSLLKGTEKMPVAEKIMRLSAATLLALPALGSVLWDAARQQGGTLAVTAQKMVSEKAG
jgi:SAM-dependent methyltransferase